MFRLPLRSQALWLEREANNSPPADAEVMNAEDDTYVISRHDVCLLLLYMAGGIEKSKHCGIERHAHT